MTPHWELAIRMLVGALLGGIIGYERDYHGRPAGLRTHMIVAVASSTFMARRGRAHRDRAGAGEHPHAAEVQSGVRVMKVETVA